MTTTPLRRLTLLALLTALSTVLGLYVRIPAPTGYLTLLDAGVLTTAMLLGKRAGATVGALGGFLNDALTGYANYMFFSLAIHGLQGFAADISKHALLNYLASGALMVAGYFLTDWLLYGSPAPALADLLGNTLQHSLGFALALIVSKLIQKSGLLTHAKS